MKKRPIQIYYLIACFIVGIFLDVFFLHKQIVREQPTIQIIIVGLPSFLFICMIFLLFIRHKIAYITMLILYLPVSIYGWITAITFIVLPHTQVVILLLICGIVTLHSLFCKPTRAYFFNKSKYAE